MGVALTDSQRFKPSVKDGSKRRKLSERELYKAKVLTSSRLARYLGTTTDKLRKFILEWKAAGVVFAPDISLAKLGLKRVCVEIDRRIDMNKLAEQPEVRAVAKTYPDRIIAFIEQPMDRKIPSYGYGWKTLFTVINSVRRRPRKEDIKAALDGKWMELLQALPKYLSKKPDLEFDLYDIKPAKFDWVDLEILDICTMDLLIPYKPLVHYLRKERGVRFTTHVDVHIRHAENLISGYYVKKIGKREGLIGFFRSYDKKFLNTITNPVVGGVGLGEYGGLIIQVKIIRKDLWFEIVDFMSTLGAEALAVVDASRMRVFGVGRRGAMYNPVNRWESVRSIDEIIRAASG